MPDSAPTARRPLTSYRRAGIASSGFAPIGGDASRDTRQKITVVLEKQHWLALLILDESTEGLDLRAKRALVDLLREAHNCGVTISFSSYVLSDMGGLARPH